MLEFQVSSLDGIDDGIKSLYTEKEGGGFQLAVNGLEDTSGLKAQQQKLLDEAKEAKSALQIMRDKNAATERKAAEDNGNFEKLFNDAETKSNTLEAQLKELLEQNKNKDINARAKDLALLSDDPNKVDMLAGVAKQYIQYGEDGITLAKDGVELTAKDIQDKLRQDYPFLVDGSKASGGGATGASGGAAGGGKTQTRAEFDAMDHVKRATFVRDGGAVIE